MASKKIIHNFDFVGRVLEILRILQEETDENTTISQKEIYTRMNENEYPCSERTLTDYLKVIMKELNPEEDDGFVDDKYGIDDYKIIVKGLKEKLHARDIGLKKEGSKKLQLRNLQYKQLFSFEELNQVIEAVLFLNNISSGKKEELIRKLQSLSSVNFPKYCPFISEITGKINKDINGVYEDSRIDEVAVRKNLEIIKAAIEADNGIGRKIAFNFNAYNENKELVSRKNKNGKDIVYIASPYYIILYNGKYYLICSVEPHNNVSFYRIDLMSNITDEIKFLLSDSQKMFSERRKPKRDVNGLPMNWDDKTASAFQTEHLYMYYGDACIIRLKLNKNRYTLLHDYFGNRYKFIRNIDEKWDEVEVKCVPQAMEVWALQCGEFVEVLEPEELRNSIIEKCKSIIQKYNACLEKHN